MVAHDSSGPVPSAKRAFQIALVAVGHAEVHPAPPDDLQIGQTAALTIKPRLTGDRHRPVFKGQCACGAHLRQRELKLRRAEQIEGSQASILEYWTFGLERDVDHAPVGRDRHLLPLGVAAPGQPRRGNRELVAIPGEIVGRQHDGVALDGAGGRIRYDDSQPVRVDAGWERRWTRMPKP